MKQTNAKLNRRSQCIDAIKVELGKVKKWRKLASRLPHTDKNPTQYIARSFQLSFTFRGICTQDVYDAIMVINLKKSTSIGIPYIHVLSKNRKIESDIESAGIKLPCVVTKKSRNKGYICVKMLARHRVFVTWNDDLKRYVSRFEATKIIKICLK